MTPPEPGARWFRSRETRESALGALILFVLINITLGPFVVGGGTLRDSVVIQSIYNTGSTPNPVPNFSISREVDMGAPAWLLEPLLILDRQQLFEQHVAPVWNPYNAFGTPLAADTQSQPYNPLAWTAMLPFEHAYDVFMMLRIYLAGLFTFLYLRKFVGMVPALGGGIAFMYTGYLWMFLTMPQLSVETLVPALLLASENLVRAPSARSSAWFALAYAWSVVGGMPEATVLAVLLGVLYTIARVAFDPLARARLRSTALYAILGAAVSFCLSAIYLLPLAEFVPRSFNTHSIAETTPPGWIIDPFTMGSLASYVAPLINGPPWNNIFTDYAGWSNSRGSFGTIAAFLALLATIGACRSLAQRTAYTYTLPSFFFAAGVFVLISKRFGEPYVNWIGYLPILKIVEFIKYEEIEIGCCVAILAGFGLEQLVKRRATYWDVIGATAILLVLYTALAGADKTAYLALAANSDFYSYSLLGGLVALAFVASASALMIRGRVSIAAGGWIAVAALALELNVAYIVPMYYVLTSPPPQTLSFDEQKIGYVDFLQAHAGNERIFGEDELLYPNWSAPYGLRDVRSLDALYDSRYLPFVQQFFSVHRDEELDNRFGGIVPTSFDSEVQQRFLQLSSIRYVAATHPIGGTLSNAITESNLDLVGSAFREGAYEIGGVRKPGIFVHPPRPFIGTPVEIPKRASRLLFSIGMLPYVWQVAPCGDGVDFKIVVESGGKSRTYDRYIDPKHIVGQRKWNAGELDIRPFRGRSARLSVATAAGPSGSTCNDWAVIGDLRFDAYDPEKSHPFSIAYSDPTVTVYRFAHPLPRIAAYAHVDAVSSPAAALAKLTDPAFRPQKDAVVESTAGNPLPDQAGGGDATPATITRYDSTHVSSTVDLSKPSLVVLNDTWYPGWEVAVDGVRKEMLHANYLFRGVIVPAGTHTITFEYRSWTFEVGRALLIVGSIAIAIMLFGGSIASRRRRSIVA